MGLVPRRITREGGPGVCAGKWGCVFWGQPFLARGSKESEKENKGQPTPFGPSSPHVAKATFPRKLRTCQSAWAPSHSLLRFALDAPGDLSAANAPRACGISRAPLDSFESYRVPTSNQEGKCFAGLLVAQFGALVQALFSELTAVWQGACGLRCWCSLGRVQVAGDGEGAFLRLLWGAVWDAVCGHGDAAAHFVEIDGRVLGGTAVGGAVDGATHFSQTLESFKGFLF